MLWPRGVNVEIFNPAPGVGGRRGPALAELRRKYPETYFAGVFPQGQLARCYAAADVFVFPSKTDTFGLVLLEALACGPSADQKGALIPAG